MPVAFWKVPILFGIDQTKLFPLCLHKVALVCHPDRLLPRIILTHPLGPLVLLVREPLRFSGCS